MKKNLKNLSILLLVFVGCFACKEDKNIDTEPRNIELKKQALSIVEKAVQGEWKVYSISTWTCWSHTLDYPQNHYMNFNFDKNLFLESCGDSIDMHQTNWRKDESDAFVLFSVTRNQELMFFDAIKNDSLYVVYPQIIAGNSKVAVLLRANK